MAQSRPATGASISTIYPNRNRMEPPIAIHFYLGDPSDILDTILFRLMPSPLRHQFQDQRGASRLCATGGWDK